MKGCPLSIIINKNSGESVDDCNKKLLIAHDLMDVLSGKWKMGVILELLRHEKRRFKELQKDLSGISARILSNVLKDLEENHIVIRTAIDASTITVEYGLTDYGKSLKNVIIDFIKHGAEHRKEVMGK
jgi:DNA-binding HxlR family transcriptional regulator